MLSSKKGAALLQVLLVTAILAGLATLLLRVTMSRSATSRQTRRSVSAQVLVDACAAEVNMLWAAKKPEVFARDVRQCIMYCNSNDFENFCPTDKSKTVFTCQNKMYNGVSYSVTATMSNTEDDGSVCKVVYEITGAASL